MSALGRKCHSAARTSKLKAFSVGFGKTIYDETDAARQTAAHYGAQFEAIDCSNEVMAENFLKTIFHIEQPIANPNSIAINYDPSHLIRLGVAPIRFLNEFIQFIPRPRHKRISRRLLFALGSVLKPLVVDDAE